MPVYNAAPFLRECIDSILCQTFPHFELLIVDDGSTDGSRDIVRGYADPRIRLIENRHDYIGSLNRLLDEARGKYIARMDADDIMLPERLQIQYDYMEAHPETDVLGGMMSVFQEKESAGQLVSVRKGRVSLSDMIDACCLFHPTVMFRSSSLETPKRFRYDRDMAYAEDYALWVELLSYGKHLYNMEDALVRYRIHKSQITSTHHGEQSCLTDKIRRKAMVRLSELTAAALSEGAEIPATDKKLTVVIPFMNEGEEVGNTVRSIRETVHDEVDIIVINDGSDDGYDYGKDLEGLDVCYLQNSYRLGAALTKERGAQLSKTPYFLLLDAHMRFYQTDWAQYITSELDKNPKRLLCSKSISLNKDEKGNVFVVPDSNQPKGAYLLFDPKKIVPGIEWNNYEGEMPTEDADQIPCVLGAGYATSKSYWNRIRGLQGLIHYGCEEAYISIKAWKEGGGCYLLPRLAIGHIYRKKFPYQVHSVQIYYNNLVVSELLFPTSERMFARAVAWLHGKTLYHRIMELMEVRSALNADLKRHYDTLRGNDFGYVKHLNEICRKVAQNPARISDGSAREVAGYLERHIGEQVRIGLFDGMAGILVAGLLYASAGHPEADGLVSAAWERLQPELSREHGLMFESGFAGVGWALIYLASHRLIEDDIEDELAQIDKKIMTLSVKRTADMSFKTGLGGIYCYVVARLGFNRRNGRCEEPFSADFLQELDDAAPQTLEKTDNWRTMNFVSQFMQRQEADWEILAPEFVEIAELPDYVPKSVGQWKMSLSGIVGSLINKVTNEYKVQNEKELL